LMTITNFTRKRISNQHLHFTMYFIIHHVLYILERKEIETVRDDMCYDGNYS
jgi:hypothetical protein